MTTAAVDEDATEWVGAVERVLSGETAAELFAQVASGYVTALSDGSLERHCSYERLERLGRVLVLQEQAQVDPPALHTVIANHQSGGHPEIIDQAAARLGPLLRELVAAGAPAKNVLLMVVLLRHADALDLDQGVISALHLDTVDAFSAGDLSLPYSCAFTAVYDRNRDDIAGVLADPTRRDRFLDGLPSVHRLVFEWLTNGGLGPGGSDGDADSAAAQRSLLARQLATGTGELGGPGDQDGLGDRDDLADLVTAARVRAAALTVDRSGATSSAASRLEDRMWMAAHGATAMARRVLRVPGRRRPRVAVCISGQLRGYRAAHETWTRSLLAAADCDLFVHTWSNVGRSSAEGFRSTLPFAGAAFSEAYRSVALAVGFDEVKARYPTLFGRLEESEHVTVEELRSFYGTEHVVVDDDRTAAFDGWTNQDKMHWKIQSAHDLIETTGVDYDLVVRVRPDKPIEFTAFAWRDLLEVCTRSATVLADGPSGVHYAKLVVGDQFAIGSPEAMAIYSNTYSIYPSMSRAALYQCPDELSGHSSIAQVCWLHGIEVRRVPMKFGTLQEVSPLGTASVLECIEADAAGRMDASDQALLAAARTDTARS